MKMLLLLLACGLASPVFAQSTYEIVPGKSLGSVKIGLERDDALKQGFVLDPDKDAQIYLTNKNKEILIRFDGGSAVQIFFQGQAFDKLRLRGEKLPLKKDAKILPKFFKKCDPDVPETDGFVMYCEDNGVELKFSQLGSFTGFSVISPTEAAKILATPKRDEDNPF